MRLVTRNDKSYYVYGIQDSGFYLKDVSLPQKYRFGNIRFDGHGMSADEQKHYWISTRRSHLSLMIPVR